VSEENTAAASLSSADVMGLLGRLQARTA
jgi:hypothetical protein